MKLNELIQGIAISDRRGRLDADIRQIVFDSRRVEDGDLFVAVRGRSSDGHAFIPDAVAKGARAVLAEEWPEVADQQGRPDVVLVPNTRRALAVIASNLYQQPSRRLLLAGVTGTNGKTTVTHFLESIIKAASRKVGLVGTVECRYGDVRIPTQHTTPDPVFLGSVLARMAKDGVSHAVMEVSSHALAQDRVAGLHFKVAAFTNLTQDHLDYHASMEEYFGAKQRLFAEVLPKSRARGRMAVVNADDPRSDDIVKGWTGKTLRVSTGAHAAADVVALEARYGLDGTEARIKTPKGTFEIRTHLVGEHNLSNALVAVGMALAMGFSRSRILRGLAALERVPGRLDRIPDAQGRRVFVDYAHTPDALERTLGALRPLTEGRLIVVFGCGGDRDATKRPLMGKVVAQSADLAIVTNDNPRSEDPRAIAAAVEQGLLEGGFGRLQGEAKSKTYLVELDRRAAIRAAIGLLGEKDVLVIAGKGHETYQIIGAEHRRFDDREEARRLLAGEPPPPPELLGAEGDALSADDAEIESVSADDLEDIGDAEEVGVSQVVDAVEVVGTLEILAEDPAELAEARAAARASDDGPPGEGEAKKT